MSTDYEVIIVGGSYSGLAAAMSLGRSLRKVLVIDSGKPCNSQTPHSHNFLTQDGKTPAEIAKTARQQVEQYNTVSFLDDIVVRGIRAEDRFEITTAAGKLLTSQKLIFATGIKDLLPDIEGLAECWGISVIHCPYCHGYEVRKEKTGILGNGEYGYEFSGMISNWTDDLTLFTNGPSTLTAEQMEKLKKHNISVVEKEVAKFEHVKGQLRQIVFKDGSHVVLKALYTRAPFEQHCKVPEMLGCELVDGFIKVDTMQKTTVAGVFACGDNATRMRSVASAVGTGTMTGAVVNREMIFDNF